MSRLVFSCAAFMLMILSCSEADARRIVVDEYGEVDLSGYCDLNGDDCTAKPLGFSVELGGVTYNSFVLYGNGTITLGNTAVSTATITGATKLSDYGVPVISSGIDNSPDIYFGGGFLQSGSLNNFAPAGNIGASFDVYLGSQSSKGESGISITAYDNGLDVKLVSFVNADEGEAFSVTPAPFTTVDPQLAGYYIPGVSDEESYIDSDSGALDYFIPGKVTFGSAVPEASSWLLMIAGMGMIGLALRFRAALRALPA